MTDGVQVITDWRGQDLLQEIMDGADDGLAKWAHDTVAIDKYTTARKTGALANSKRTAPPNYNGDDTAASKAGDLAEKSAAGVQSQIVDHAIALGSWSDYAYKVEVGDGIVAAQPSTMPAIDTMTSRLPQYLTDGISRRTSKI